MDKQQIISRTQEVLSPLETENVVSFLKELSFATLIDSPLVLCLFLLVLFFAVIKRSKFVLLFLFTVVSLLALVHYSLPNAVEMNVTSLLPFAFGCLAIGAVIIYFTFIKVE